MYRYPEYEKRYHELEQMSASCSGGRCDSEDNFGVTKLGSTNDAECYFEEPGGGEFKNWTCSLDGGGDGDKGIISSRPKYAKSEVSTDWVSVSEGESGLGESVLFDEPEVSLSVAAGGGASASRYALSKDIEHFDRRIDVDNCFGDNEMYDPAELSVLDLRDNNSYSDVFQSGRQRGNFGDGDVVYDELEWPATEFVTKNSQYNETVFRENDIQLPLSRGRYSGDEYFDQHVGHKDYLPAHNNARLSAGMFKDKEHVSRRVEITDTHHNKEAQSAASSERYKVAKDKDQYSRPLELDDDTELLAMSFDKLSTKYVMSKCSGDRVRRIKLKGSDEAEKVGSESEPEVVDVELEKACVELHLAFSGAGLQRAQCATLDFSNPVYQTAYIGLCVASHLSAILKKLSCFYGESSMFKQFISNHPTLNVCSIGGGPGTDIIGLSLFLEKYGLPNLIEGTIFDLYYQWERPFKALQKRLENSNISPKIHVIPFDYFDPMSNCLVDRLKTSDVVMMVKFVCNVNQDYELCFTILCDMFSCVKSGAVVFLVDYAGGHHFEIVEEAAQACGMQLLTKSRRENVQTCSKIVERLNLSRNCCTNCNPLRYGNVTGALYIKV